MILLDEDSSQRPKLPTDPSVGPTNRVPTEADPSSPPSSSQQRPPSLNTVLPNYESLEAQHPSPSKPRGGRRPWRTRLGRFMAIALVIYLCLFVILGVPTFVLVRLALSSFLIPVTDFVTRRSGEYLTNSNGAETTSLTTSNHHRQWTMIRLS
jgi:hypothetical protein